MISTRQYLLLISLSFPCLISFSQKDPNLKPDRSRELFHGYVDKEQQIAQKSDGRDDKKFTVSANEEINFFVTNALIKKIDQLQYKIEKDSTLGAQAKVRYIRGLERLLRDLNLNWRAKRFSVTNLPAIVEAYGVCLEKDKKGMTIENVINQLEYNVGRPVVASTAFDDNSGIKRSRNILIRKLCSLYPEKILPTLRQNPDLPFADSLIRIAAYKFPKQLYNYAAANNKLGIMIRQIDDDPLIRTISQMASRSKSGQWYFPFLDNILKGKMTMADIDAVKEDPIKYYKLLVKTHIDYVERAVQKDTAMEFETLTERMVEKAISVFVNTINGLHNESNAVRFRIIQSLSATELYYLAVLSDGIIYTSSYVNGVYPLLMSRVNNRGDSVLKAVYFDKYRKFIKMAAGYNTLSNYLASFPNKDDASVLMRAFVSNLENTTSLEDGVDVADSYASIAETIKPLADQMLGNVKLNYQRNILQNNKRGVVIYNLLQKLFLSADTSQNIDLTRELGIPPVYNVDYKFLANDSGRVIMQVFFYGDKDGKNIFQGFQKMFSSASWRIIPDKQWITINSTKGSPVSIFANRPLPEENGEDEKAQKALDSFLAKKSLSPTVVIHRGHSYYAPYTIQQVLPSAKIVFLGSCGGYHLIHDILKNAPDAHIIASKQIGKTAINRPFFELLMEKVRGGNNIEWIPFWQEFRRKVAVEGFEDYIPPHKNLGAIFIKAYKIAMGEDDLETIAVAGGS
jgi:hypothetical protein